MTTMNVDNVIATTLVDEIVQADDINGHDWGDDRDGNSEHDDGDEDDEEGEWEDEAEDIDDDDDEEENMTLQSDDDDDDDVSHNEWFNLLVVWIFMHVYIVFFNCKLGKTIVYMYYNFFTDNTMNVCAVVFFYFLLIY